MSDLTIHNLEESVKAGLQLATRNTRDFADIQDLGVINPWLAI